MKTLKSVFIFILFIAGISCFEAKGQVTIGSDIAPLEGVLLDIKTKAGTAGLGDATTDAAGGGLGLPRVALTSVSSLAPFLPSATSAQMKDRTGLMVYNISNTSPFKAGVYVWDGEKWNVAGRGVKWFYMPSVNVTITSTGTGKTFDLYNAYKNQFTKQGNATWASNNSNLSYVPSPENTGLYASTELDYIITYYDQVVFNNVSVSNSGMLTYDVNTLNTTPKTYFNVVFVVKK
jgi:hypothetical protein